MIIVERPSTAVSTERPDPAIFIETGPEIRRFAELLTIRPALLRVGDLDQREPTLVTSSSPRRLRTVVYTTARYFRREFGYDFPGFPHPDDRDDRLWEAWLWPASAARYASVRPLAVGACCFRRMRWDCRPGRTWTMTWIWLHPFARRRGLLTEAWDAFVERYGDFILEPPLSDAMEGFAADRGLTRLGSTYTAARPTAGEEEAS